MAEEIIIHSETKQSKYEELLPQLKALAYPEDPLVSNLANICAALKSTFDFFWVGFYLAEENELTLGPFQGPVACTRITWGKGVCGTAAQEKKTQLVPNVDAFPGHIACSSLSKSEIVVPVLANGTVKMVLDIDSKELNSFDETDQKYLEELASWIGQELCK